MASKVFEHPFDLTKVRLQSQVLDATARFKGPIDCLSRTFRDEGVRGLYRVRRFTSCLYGMWPDASYNRDYPHRSRAPWSKMRVSSCRIASYSISCDGSLDLRLPKISRFPSSQLPVRALAQSRASFCMSITLSVIDLLVK